jgi:multiple sugar transport system substrate-binding protein
MNKYYKGLPKVLIVVIAFALVSCAAPAPTATTAPGATAVPAATSAPVATKAPATSAPASSAVSTNAAPVTIEWSQWFQDTSEAGTIDKLIAEFQALYPNIKVKPVNLPFAEVRNQVITNAAAGQLPDVIGMNPPWMGEFVGMGLLEPLDAYMAADKDFKADELIQAPMAKYQGKTWMLPYTGLAFVLFYNKALFAEAGLSRPPQNWAEVRDYAKKLTNPAKNQYGISLALSEQAPANGSIIWLYPMIYAAGGRTLKDGKSNINSPEVVAALKLVKDLVDEKSVAPGTASKTETQMTEEFATGNIGMLVNNTGQIGTFAVRNPKLDYSMVPFPSPNGDKKPDLRSHGWELGMSARSTHKQEAWTFMKWLVSKGPNAAMAKASKNIPANKTSDVSFLKDNPRLTEAVNIINNYQLVEELMMMCYGLN